VSHLPISVRLDGRRCCVVGGGAVAARRVDALLAADADVAVIAPALTPRLALHAADRRVRWLARAYRPGDLRDADLVFAATGDERVNEAVVHEARARRVWVNTADDPGHCDFFVPAIIRRGPVTVAISTGGASPAVARLVREDLEDQLTDEHVALADLAGDVRRELRARGASPDAGAWASALRREDVRRLAGAGRLGEARDCLRAALAAAGGAMAPPPAAIPAVPSVDASDTLRAAGAGSPVTAGGDEPRAGTAGGA
jgi:precorrin-2 dehydrogenase / sirohydrochlorin ferrochelatase